MLHFLLIALLFGSPVSSPLQDNNGIAARREADTVNQQEKEVFKLGLIGEKRASDRTHLGFRVYEGSSGTRVVVTYGTFRSPEKAEAELHRWLEPAKKIISEERTKNLLGIPVGYRATATYVDKETKKDFSAILWTNGADLWEIDSSSMAAALDFEKRINDGQPLSRN
jgi:hypothetical protein